MKIQLLHKAAYLYWKRDTKLHLTLLQYRSLLLFKFVYRTWNDFRSNFTLKDHLSMSNGFQYWFFPFFPILLSLSLVGFRLVDFRYVVLIIDYYYSYAPKISLTFFSISRHWFSSSKHYFLVSYSKFLVFLPYESSQDLCFRGIHLVRDKIK